MSLYNMRKLDLLSLFFYDPLHAPLEKDADAFSNKTSLSPTKPLYHEEVLLPYAIKEPPELSINIPNNDQDLSDPTDLTDSSMDSGLDSCSDTSDIGGEQLEMSPNKGGIRKLMEEFYEGDDMDTYDDDLVFTKLENKCFTLAEEWEGKQRTKTTWDGKVAYRLKGSEKNEYISAKKRVKAHRLKKYQRKVPMQRVSAYETPRFIPVATFRAVPANKEEADIQHAIALSLASSNTSRNNSAGPQLTVQQLSDLMYRELTPEDYELLLCLDESVAKKTVGASVLDSFASREVTEKDVKEFACTVSSLCGSMISPLIRSDMFV